MNHNFSLQEQEILLQKLYQTCKNDFYTFVRATFGSAIEGRDRFKLHWSNQELCEYLDASAKGEIEWLLISLPRGYGKSIFVSEYYPAWCLLREPSERIGCFTRAYTSDSAMWHANSMKIYNSNVAQKLHTPLHKIEKSNERIFRTIGNGYRRIGSCQTSSVGSDMTKVVIDDPHSEEHERSEALQISMDNFYRKGIFPAIRTVDYNVNLEQLTQSQQEEYLFTKSLEKEINIISKKPPTLVHCMQRLHTRDMQGVLLEILQEYKNAGYAKNAHYYALPAVSTELKTYIFPKSGITYTANANEYLEAGTLTQTVIEQRRAEMGNATFQAQMQQNPIVTGGNIIKREWFLWYSISDLASLKFTSVFITADTAYTIKTSSDYSVFIAWGVTNNGLYFLDMIRGKWESPDLYIQTKAFWNKWRGGINNCNCYGMHIEDKANGSTLMQDLKRNTQIPVFPILRITREDKYMRISAVLNMIASGKVYIPSFAPQNYNANLLLTECENFTSNNSHLHDDMVDCLADAIKIGLNIGKISSIDPRLIWGNIQS